jgi:hypothetical protein
MKQGALERTDVLAGAHEALATARHPPSVSPTATISQLLSFCEDRSFPSDKISSWYFADVADVVAQSFLRKSLLNILADHLA